MIAKSLDVLVLLKLSLDGEAKSYAQMAEELGMSASEAHAAVRRSVASGLVDPESRKVRRKPLEEYLLHGVKYAFPVHAERVVRGMPTAQAAPPLSSELAPDELPPVWPDPEGEVKGVAVEPLFGSVPGAARRDPRLYELLALVDALRLGRARERKMAEEELRKRLVHAHAA